MIPYNHSTLVPGCIASTKLIQIIQRIEQVSADSEIARENLDAATWMKRTLEMKLNELESMHIDVQNLNEKIKELDKTILNAASAYLETFMRNEEIIAGLKKEKAKIESSEKAISTPVCLLHGELKEKPWHVDSLKLDSHYFSFQGNNIDSMLAQVRQFVSQGGDQTLATEATAQVMGQTNNAHFNGTFVITASCTHRNIRMFDSLNDIDPDEAIHAWNKYHPAADQIVLPPLTTGIGAEETGEPLTIIKGAAYGSCFVGMVHLFHSDLSNIKEGEDLSNELQKKLQAGGWLSYMNGELGVDPEILEQVRSILVKHTITSQVSLLVSGVFPTLKANTLNDKFPKMSKIPDDDLEKLLDSEAEERQTVASANRNSIYRMHYLNAQNKRLSTLLETASKTDKEQNNVIDLNSLLTAFDNYITTISDGKDVYGIPIRFFTEELTKADIIRLWNKKYRQDDEE